MYLAAQRKKQRHSFRCFKNLSAFLSVVRRGEPALRWQSIFTIQWPRIYWVPLVAARPYINTPVSPPWQRPSGAGRPLPRVRFVVFVFQV